MTRPLKVGDVLRHVLPNGSRGGVEENATPLDSDYELVPYFPPDLFAAVGTLLELSGAYHHIIPGAAQNGGPAAGDEGWPARTLHIDKPAMAKWRRLAAQWAHSPTLPLDSPTSSSSEMPAEIQDLWRKLWNSRAELVYSHPDDGIPSWWNSAFGLLVVADEACVDVGYGVPWDQAAAAEPVGDRSSVSSMADVPRPTWIAQAVYVSSLHAIDKSKSAEKKDHVRVTASNVSITSSVNFDVVCVQPKARTPKVGCTLRTLSHNLSLLPPHGIVKAHWQRLPFEEEDVGNQDLNILLIPFPYRMEPSWFASHMPTGAADDPNWAWFSLRQEWLSGGMRDEIVRFTIELMKEAKARTGQVHGVVFPEYALDWELHEKIANSILADEALRSCEFLISGSSKNCLDREEPDSANAKGNFVLVSQFANFKKQNGQIKRTIFTSSRAKHHRWAIDRVQAESYGFQDLEPFVGGKTLWEKIGISHREIHVHAFRQSSVFATMICEDLARSDPCHELLRAIGPSIVFVLLMDGPQLQHRWSARYATALADDPGSSVLTFTSLGLIERANGTASYPASRVVALWKDDTGRTREITLPENKHGIVISLKGSAADERTLDGRSNSDTTRWRFRYQQAVRVPIGNETTVQKVVDGSYSK